MYIFLAVIGLVAGLLGGLLGIGGGIVTVPSFLYFFYLYSYPQSMHTAIGTALGVMIFTAGSSALSHYYKNGILWTFLRGFAPGIILGTISGALIADLLPSDQLKMFFGAYALFFGLRFLVLSKRKRQTVESPKFPSLRASLGMGVLTGAISSVLGIGGALFTIPFLTRHHISLRQAISTSSFVGLLIAVVGSISFMCFGLDEKLGDGSLGYIYLPGVFITGIASVLTAPLGAKLAYVLPIEILDRIFGIFLIIVGLLLIF